MGPTLEAQLDAAVFDDRDQAVAAAYSPDGDWLLVLHTGMETLDILDREITVAHEDIPGFMPAMTMTYVVKDAVLLKDRAPGDLITATLTVESTLGYLSAIVKTGSAPLPEDARTTIPAAANVAILKNGDRPPEARLIDQDEKPISLNDFRGMATAITFIFCA